MHLQSSDFDISRHTFVQKTIVKYCFGLFCMGCCPAAGLTEIGELMTRFVDQVPNPKHELLRSCRSHLDQGVHDTICGSTAKPYM